MLSDRLILADVSNMKLTGKFREGAQRWLVDWIRITIVGFQ